MRTALLAVALAVFVWVACAQQSDRFPTPPPPSGPTPRAANGKPDLSGVWLSPRTVQQGMPEMLPSAASVFKQRTENHGREMPSGLCLPLGVTLLAPFVNKFIQTPGLLVVLREADASFRQVFLDRSEHPKDLEPTWSGHSIGRWQDDTLVVDTIGFNEIGWIDALGHPRTEKLKVIQEFRRPDLGHLEIQTTIDDPGAYTKPWTLKHVADLAPSEEIKELICAENNKDLGHLVGK